MILPFFLVVFGASVLMGLLWLFFGRDEPPTPQAFTAFPPPFPAWAAGILVDEHLDGVDWLALILHLVQAGALKMVREEGELRVVCVPERAPENPAERALHAFVCERGGLSLEHPPAGRELEPVARVIYDELTRQGWFAHNPWRVRRLYRDLGHILMLAGLLGVIVGVLYGMVPSWIGFSLGLIPAGWVVRTVGEHMPRKTAKGSWAAEMLHHLQRALHHRELPGDPEGLLPYALVLGMVGDVVQNMDSPPSWWPDEEGFRDALTLDLPLLGGKFPSFG